MLSTVAPILPIRLDAGDRKRCAHCGGDAGAGPTDGADAFCCRGCLAAHRLLRGLAPPDAAENAVERYADLDDPAFAATHVRTAAGLAQAEFFVPNIHCATCVSLLERLPGVLAGVVELRVDLPRQTAMLRWRPSEVRLSAVAAALDGLGYPPHPILESAKEAASRAEDRKQLGRLAVAFACAGNTMLIALAQYLGAFSDLAVEHARLFDWAATGLGLVAIAGPGRVFFRGAWSALRTRTPHMDLPVALGLAVGGVAGVVNTIFERGGHYFDSLAMLVFLLLVGRYLQFRQQRRAADSVALLRGLMPRAARVVEGSELRRIPLTALTSGMLVEVRPGETIPADGAIEVGSTTVDLSLLTGESTPVGKVVGDAVHGGAGNLGGVVRIRLSAVGENTRVGQVLRLAEASAARKPPLVAFADRMAGRFVLVVIVLAIVALVWWWSVGVGKAVDVAVALLIVSCPCALGLATPLALAVGQGQAARRGILVQSGDVFERLARPGELWLDKTGTLTEGKHVVAAWTGDPSSQRIVAAIETHSSHPLARALVAEYGAKLGEPPLPDVAEFRQEPRGVSGFVAGAAWLVGAEDYLHSRGVGAPSPTLSDAATYAIRRGCTPVWIARNGAALAVAALGDKVRADAAGAVAELQAAGWNVGVLSGDDPQIVSTVAAAVGVPAERSFGGLAPEEKLRRILESGARSAMVGDGVNDAAALAAAGVGVAVNGGAETSLRAAPVYLARPGLRPLVELVAGSRRVLRTVHRNYAVSLAYNLAFVGLALAGCITPLVAAILMPISSLTVVGLALSSRMFPEAA